MPETTFLRLLAYDDKAAAVAALRDGAACPDIYRADPASFAQMSGSPMASWFSQRLRDKFASLSPIESPPREARRGSWAGDDFRYLRIWCEVATSSIKTSAGDRRLEAAGACGGFYGLQYVKKHGSITRKDVVDLCLLGEHQASRLLRRLVDKGVLLRVGERKGTVYERACIIRVQRTNAYGHRH